MNRHSLKLREKDQTARIERLLEEQGQRPLLSPVDPEDREEDITDELLHQMFKSLIENEKADAA